MFLESALDDWEKRSKHLLIFIQMMRSGFSLAKHTNISLSRAFGSSRSLSQNIQIDVGADSFSTHSKSFYLCIFAHLHFTN